MGLPGGRVKRGEQPIDAAAREMREEVGIAVATDALRPVYADLWIRIFEYRPDALPRIRPDNVEVVEARFVDPAEIKDPDNALSNYLRSRVP